MAKILFVQVCDDIEDFIRYENIKQTTLKQTNLNFPDPCSTRKKLLLCPKIPF